MAQVKSAVGEAPASSSTAVEHTVLLWSQMALK